VIKFESDPVNHVVVNYQFGLTKKYGPDYHNGVDLGAKKVGVIGDKIYSVNDGTVAFIRLDSPSGGKYVIIQHDGYCTGYYHCMEIVVKEGMEVEAGQIIAYMGSTGKSTGPHLHFEVRIGKYSSNYWIKQNGRYINAINPEQYLLENVTKLTVEKAKQIVKSKAQISDTTLQYMVNDYRWGDELIIKLAKAMR